MAEARCGAGLGNTNKHLVRLIARANVHAANVFPEWIEARMTISNCDYPKRSALYVRGLPRAPRWSSFLQNNDGSSLYGKDGTKKFDPSDP
jgi:hypothetical protein